MTTDPLQHLTPALIKEMAAALKAGDWPFVRAYDNTIIAAMRAAQRWQREMEQTTRGEQEG